jgi:hypothetical protein
LQAAGEAATDKARYQAALQIVRGVEVRRTGRTLSPVFQEAA